MTEELFYKTFIHCLTCRRDMADEIEEKGHIAQKHMVEKYLTMPSNYKRPVKPTESEEL